MKVKAFSYSFSVTTGMFIEYSSQKQMQIWAGHIVSVDG